MAEVSAEAGSRHAGYGRLSIDTDDTTSPARQKKIIGRRIEDRSGIFDPTVDYYEDIDKSGFDEAVDRPGFNLLMDNLDKYDVIVVYRLDRLTRRIGKFAQVLKKLQENNVTLVSATESFDTSDPMGQAMVWIIMVFAQLESETIGVRMQSAQNHMVRHGKYRGGQRPFGWEKSNTGKAGGTYLTQTEPEASLLLDAIDAVLDGVSIRSICVGWNDDGIKTARGNDWAQGTLSHLLRNPVLIGRGIFGEAILRDDDGVPLQVAEPLISEVKFTKLQDMLDKRSQGGKGVTRNLSLLAGIATCALCGRSLSANARSYVCPSFNDAHEGKGTASLTKRDCVGVCVERAKLDPWVLTYVLENLNRGALRKVEAKLAAEHAKRMAANSYEEQRAELNRKLDRLEEDRYDGLYDSLEERARFKKRRSEIIDELVVLDEENKPVELFDGFDTALSMDELLSKDIREVRRFLIGVLGKLEVSKGTRGSRRPVSDRVEISFVEALQGGKRSPRKRPPTARAS